MRGSKQTKKSEGAREVAALRRRARLGVASAQFKLACRYMRGDAVKENRRLSFKWMLRAATQGHVRATTWVGYMYRRGVGVRRDATLGSRWLTLAAAKRDWLARELMSLTR